MTGPAGARKRADEVAYVTTDSRTVLLHLGRLAENPTALNDSAGVIWGLVDGHRSDEDIVQAVAELYGLPVNDVAAAVLQTLRWLTDGGYLDWVDHPEREAPRPAP